MLLEFILTNNAAISPEENGGLNQTSLYKSSPLVAAESTKKLPGDLAMWFFILAELTVFAIFFVGFAITEQLYPNMFILGKAQLHPTAGLINTLALITSSFFVALSLTCLHQKQTQKTIRFLWLAQLLAMLYLAVKMWEYNFLFSIGIGIETNTFFTLYFLITFFHFLHVVLGMVILGFMMRNTSQNKYVEQTSGFEAGASYWHMVDMLWIILFPLIYIV
jgi:nitric oxide reductase NorE protein